MRHRYEVEAEVPPRRGGGQGNSGEHDNPDSLPQIRRQVERICEALGIAFDDLGEMHITPGQVIATLYQRDEGGEFFRNEFGKVATEQKRFPVDTTSFLGDERDV